MSDPYTMSLRMCDDDGMVSRERGVLSNSNLTYLDIHNNLRSHTASGLALVTEPFACTGSAHLAGEHILCTSPAHKDRAMWSDQPGVYIEPDGTVVRAASQSADAYADVTGTDGNDHYRQVEE